MLIKVLGYLIVLLFIVISEQYIRREGVSKSFASDHRVDQTTLLYSGSIIVIMSIAPILNNFQIGSFNNNFVGAMGIVFLLGGMLIRVVAMKTLGKYFTRSLVTLKNQNIIQEGIYTYIRHPGYLGTIVGGLGFGLTQMNIFLIVLVLILMFVIYCIRIRKEEQMMLRVFGEKYRSYLKKTTRLIPFII